MDVTQLLPSLPLFIVLTLLLSYLIWAKFLRSQRKVSVTPKNAKDLETIAKLFFFFGFILSGLVLELKFTTDILSLNFNILSGIPSYLNVTFTLLITVFIMIWCFIENKKMMISSLLVLLWTSLVFTILACCFFLFFKIFNFGLISNVWSIVPFWSAISFVLSAIFFKRLFKKESSNVWKSKNIWILMVIIITALVFTFVYVVDLPRTEFGGIEKGQYVLNDEQGLQTYQYFSVPVNVLNQGKLSWFPINIPISNISYDNYFEKENFVLYLNKSGYKETIVSYKDLNTTNEFTKKEGISKLIWKDNKQITIFYDDSFNKSNPLVVEGLKKINITSPNNYSYSVSNNGGLACENSSCWLAVNFSNHLDNNLKSDEFDAGYAWGKIAMDNCTFENVSYGVKVNGSYPYPNKQLQDNSCSKDGSSCDLENLPHLNYLMLERHGSHIVMRFSLERDTDINFVVFLKCQY